jgi:hypothetical protein
MTTEYDQTNHEHDHSRGFTEGEKHPARVTGCLWDKAQSGGLCLALKFRITGGPREGEELRGRLYFDTERSDSKGRTAFDRSMEALDAMGCSGDLESIVDGDGAGVLDRGDVEVVVGLDKNGYPGAKFINRPNSGGVQLKAFDAPTEQDKRSFFAQMKARAQAAGRSAKAAGTAPMQPRPAPAQRPAPQAPQPTRGPGAPRSSAPAYDPTDGFAGDDSEIPF